MYNYETEKPKLFTDENQIKFIKLRDNVLRIVKEAGCIRMGEATNYAGSGDSWTMLAMVDRMVEMGELREIKCGDCAGQHRIFIQPYNS